MDYVAAVTIDRIAAIRADIASAVNQKASRPGSQQEADDALMGACRGACGLLSDWLEDDGWWQGLGPADGTIADAIPSQDDFVRLLGPTFRDAIGMLKDHGISIDHTHVDEARIAVNETASRHGEIRRQELFDEARSRVEQLSREVCSLARDAATSAVRRRRAISLLKRTAKVLASLALSIALNVTVTAQHQIAHDIVHESLSVLVSHQIAHEAEPNLRIEPRGPEMEIEMR